MKAEIIAEIGSNWEGNILTAKKIISECKKAGADAVKFQMWRAHDLYNPKHSSWKIIKKSELSFKQVKTLKEFSDKQNIEFFCSVFYPETVEFLEKLDVKRYKIASRTCLFKDPHSMETLREISKTGKPVIISMGMGGNKKKIQKIFHKNKKLFCYCISEYPLDIKKIVWNKALRYQGFSDHTEGIIAPLIFSSMKNTSNTNPLFIEKHVKLPNSKGPDASTSIDTSELKQLIKHIRIIEKIKNSNK
tara:strand:- start:748 stop:1488 length:741 start_codon:yes stop_codon:yes gene_type:complete